RQRDIVRADFAFDEVKDLESDLFGVFDFRAGWRPQPNRHLPGISVGKNFDPELPADKHDNERGSQHIEKNHWPTESNKPRCNRGIAGLKASERACLVRLAGV